MNRILSLKLSTVIAVVVAVLVLNGLLVAGLVFVVNQHLNTPTDGSTNGSTDIV